MVRLNYQHKLLLKAGSLTKVFSRGLDLSAIAQCTCSVLCQGIDGEEDYSLMSATGHCRVHEPVNNPNTYNFLGFHSWLTRKTQKCTASTNLKILLLHFAKQLVFM